MTQLPPNHQIDRELRHLERMARQQATVIAWINSIMEFLMANAADLAAEIASLKQAVADDQASDQAVVDQLDQTIADLKAGGDTSATIAALEDIKAQIKPVTSASSGQSIPPAP